ncbi:unnamed protein product [Rhodiola kirilowii]
MEKPDYESNNHMGDPMGDSAMTIEFLRARLLSERSVSKSARRRADELADRVVELEEQLKVVFLQRKKAEKATSDVLAILETFGLSDSSEGCDSSSDQDSTHPKSSNGNCSTKNTDKSRGIDQQGLESPTFSNRSLSWKSSKCSSHCDRKLVSASSRRHNSFLSTESASPKHHRLGKSCRQVKRREMRPTVDKLINNEVISDSQTIDDDSKLSSRNHENQDEDLPAGDAESICIRNLRKLIDSEHHFHKNERDNEMERALENQSELICRYEAEENAQIEWEEKYRENNSSTPESVEPGNQSDVTEERDEMKIQPACFWPVNEDAHSGVKVAGVVNEVCVSLSNDEQPSSQATYGLINCQKQISHPESAVPMNKTKHIQEKSEGCSYHSPSPAIHQSLVSSSQAAANDKYSEGEASKTTSGKSIFVSHKPSKELGSVLEALQKAKLSLQHKLRNLPLSEDRYMGKAVHVSAVRSAFRGQIPAISATLYRVPSNLEAEPNVYKNNLDSRSQSSLMNYYHDSTAAVPANDQFKLTPHAGLARSNVSESSSLDFSPNRNKTLSNQGSGDEYAQSPSILFNKGISSSGHFKFSPQNGVLKSTLTDSNGPMPSPFHDSDFSFNTSDIYRSSSQHEYNRSSFNEIGFHVQSTNRNGLSSSSIDRRGFNPQGKAIISSSLIDNSQFVRNPYNGSISGISSPSQILGNTSSGSSQRFSPELGVSLSSRARHSYRPAHPSVLDFNPPMPSFSGFPSFPPSPASAEYHGPGMYRI